MSGSISELVLAGSGIGLAGGLLLFVRGLRAYRTASTVEGLPSSELDSLAAGEVRVSGTVSAGMTLLVSPLQSQPCVYFRSRVVESRGRSRVTTFRSERAVQFTVHDGSGSIRVFPRAARMDVPNRWDESSDLNGDPPGLAPNRGPLYEATELDREEAIAQLLTVRQPSGPAELELPTVGGGPRHYEEARIELGDLVTIIGPAIPFSELADPADAAIGRGEVPLDDPSIAEDLAAAGAAGELADSAEEAWGNAAIPGFGIGRPARAPELDPAARAMPVVAAAESDEALPAFEIPPEELVLAALPGDPLTIHLGTPAATTARYENRFILGIGGAILSIASAIALALAVGGQIR